MLVGGGRVKEWPGQHDKPNHDRVGHNQELIHGAGDLAYASHDPNPDREDNQDEGIGYQDWDNDQADPPQELGARVEGVHGGLGFSAFKHLQDEGHLSTSAIFGV
jgi:hypothetical protein